MIITCKPRISFLWIILATLPWVAVIFKDKVMGIAFTFSMRKFVENPAALTFLLTVPAYIAWFVPPTVNFLADRIWTRWGRRKPFIVVSWLGTMTSIALMPIAPNFWWLLAAFTCFSVFNALGGPVESLKMEIVPPAQRATSAAVMSWIGQVAVLVFWVVAIGRFNEVSELFGSILSGEQALFWTVSLGMIVMLVFLMLGIKETNPHSALQGERFGIKSIFRGLFNVHLWPVFILVFSCAILGTGLGAFNLLLTTEQWGYSNQEMGNNIMVGGLINLALIPLLGLLANKVGRGRVYVSLVIIGIVVNFSMYLYYNFVLYDGRPTLIEMIVFGEMLSVTGILTSMALTPFQYDFIPRNELGTFAAGSGLVSLATNIGTTTLMGLFVWGYAALFLGPPGETVRVALRDDTPQAQVQMLLSKATWTDPETGAPLAQAKVTAQPWYATGAKLHHGRGYEIRLRNDSSALLREQRDLLEEARGVHRARRGYAEDRLRELTGAKAEVAAKKVAEATPLVEHACATVVPNDPEAVRLVTILVPATLTKVLEPRKPDPQPIAQPQGYARALIREAEQEAEHLRKQAGGTKEERLRRNVEAEKACEKRLSAGIDNIDGLLTKRAEAFRRQVETALGDRLLRDGEQLLAAGEEPAVIATFALRQRPDAAVVERVLDRLRLVDPTVIDLRIVPAGNGVALALSARGQRAEPAKPGVEAKAGISGRRLQDALTAGCEPEMFSALGGPVPEPTLQETKCLRMDLRILEDPLDRHPSPISRVVNSISSLFTDPPRPEQRLAALARNLRRPVGPEIKISQPIDAVTGRLATLLPQEAREGASLLYAVAGPMAKERRMTIATPVLAAGYAKQQYDYLAGYIATFALQLVGLGITFFFLYLVKTGAVRRRGAEEAEAVQ